MLHKFPLCLALSHKHTDLRHACSVCNDKIHFPNSYSHSASSPLLTPKFWHIPDHIWRRFLQFHRDFSLHSAPQKKARRSNTFWSDREATNERWEKCIRFVPESWALSFPSFVERGAELLSAEQNFPSHILSTHLVFSFSTHFLPFFFAFHPARSRLFVCVLVFGETLRVWVLLWIYSVLVPYYVIFNFYRSNFSYPSEGSSTAEKKNI